ncbi:MAG: DUF6287 domain-containing protein [Streptococcaceae bacterium]|nr:DUF6287 domain-containing protein [Streptococcaceae bacterium]
MKRKTLIIGLTTLAVLIAGSVSAAVIHNQQVSAQQKSTAKANEARYLKEANTDVDKAYQTKKVSDIKVAQSAIKKLNSTDKKSPTDKLTLLTNALSDLSSADKLVSVAEKAKSTAETNLAQTNKEAQAKIDAQKMDLDAISKGDYSSIQGTWTDASGITISVDKNTITDMNNGIQRYIVNGLNIKINGKTLPLTAKMSNGQLQLSFDDGGSSADGGLGAISFVPVGVKFYSSSVYNYPDNIAKERIVSADHTHLQESQDYGAYKTDQSVAPNNTTISDKDQATIDNAVKAAQTALDKVKLSAVSAEKNGLQIRLNKASGKMETAPATDNTYQSSTGMNLEQIANSDYRSIQGTWKNASGNIITVSGTTITENGNVITPIQYVGKAYLSIAGTLNLVGQGLASPPNLFIIPKGISIAGFSTDKTDVTNQQQDRIIETENFQNSGTSLQIAAKTYYKIN